MTENNAPSVEAVAETSKAVATENPNPTDNTDSRSSYYDKWDKFAKEEVKKTEEEDKKEKEEADKALGIDKTPKSEAEARDKAKHAALKEAKKAWDQKKASEAAAKHLIENKQGEEIVFDSKLLLGKPVLLFKNNKDCKFKIPQNLQHRLVKVFLESNDGCHFDFEVELVTHHVETAHCKDCTINVKAPLNTLQLDLCERISVKYLKGHYTNDTKIYHAGVQKLTIETHEYDTHTADYIEDGAVTLGEKCAEEQQFVTHLIEERVKTEIVVRDKGNMPATRDELRKADADERTQEREAELKKIGGNEAFKEGEYAQAAIFYTEAIELAPKGKDEETGKPISDLVHVCYANRAFCFQKLGHHEKAEEDSRKCIEIEPTYVKGLFRLGLALHARKKYHEAIPILGKALSLQPKNKQIKQALGFAELKLRKSVEQP
uniref:Uncharacterized protein n=1 Tax=Aplanochytrium stocchinoi TaxID=215587 RepID=A0A7S3V2C4_9STRA|mmetsp:Transcript_18144/g.20517  ORF Transcript_18144/g.20517 Transcript_18144/m.20517 type:complete len:433 (+) Transcript_18144:25-1323(+)|eukprot:CAMPEP_0204822138 /NCGR_PEP_ID=MMETSP1346-20131115/319_1 /ASSEMBLY_ACC=CAM_ASM_000771 /TAXON_ID=215587 /ORGANISM="Aplanochytrium stocchinoi, Strain GSBS06" /LENGTH=432 /DNA_ID=CAMNT_0051948193 /DNA_START=228 /DNA_END=1526 /DNA_ORIENTATION=-